MNWFYAHNGKQIGPVSEAEFESSLKSGMIGAETLVWREGFAEWKKYREVQALGLVIAGPAEAGTFGSAACGGCGQNFPQREMVVFGDEWVCPGCKPGYLQRFKASQAKSAKRPFAGFWIRGLAKLIDALILGAVALAAHFAAGALSSASSPQHMAARMGLCGLSIVVWMIYSTVLLGKYGATPGKMLLRLKVVRPGGEPMTYRRAFGRFWAEVLSVLILGIGYLMSGWDSEKQALHDRLARTRVARTQG